MNKFLFLPMGVLTLAFPVLSAAQNSSPHPTPEPGLHYESAFAGYTPYEDVAPASWRALNDQVGQAGLKTGKQAGSPTATGDKPAVPSAASGAASHPAHGMHGGMK